jgi:intergrase/recombinase
VDATIIPVISSVVAALAAISAALISAYFQRKTARETADSARTTAELEKLRRELVRAYRQVAAYYELESIAADELAAHMGKASKTAKSEMRDEVKARGLDRPEWTRTQCESRIRDLEA